MKHYLKTDRGVFQATVQGDKNYEIRIDDRHFKVGDALVLRETDCTGQEMKAGCPLAYTGRECALVVKHILRGQIYGLQEGWVIMSTVKVPTAEE